MPSIANLYGVTRTTIYRNVIQQAPEAETNQRHKALKITFFATLKTEIGTRVWASRDDARRAVFAYLGHYNRHRPHQARDQLPPDVQQQPAAESDFDTHRLLLTASWTASSTSTDMPLGQQR